MKNIIAAAALIPTLAWLTSFAGDLPDPSLTPGAVNTTVAQANIQTTICVKGWTKTIRPPVSFTNALKRLQIRQYGYADEDLHDYEEDHLIPLSLGGAPDDPANLWPESLTGVWNAQVKDNLEAMLHRRVCDGSMRLAEAQRLIRSNWIEAYKQLKGREIK